MFFPLNDKNPVTHVKAPYVNYGIIIVTCLIFLIQLATSRYEDFTLSNFGMIPVIVRDVVSLPNEFLPDGTSLFTYAFLHADFMHLASNMLFLWVFGDNIEDAMGHVRYFFFYGACAILAGLAFLIFNFNGTGPLIGASGAVAGIIGAYLVLHPRVKVFVITTLFAIPLPLRVPALWVLGLWIVMQFLFVIVDAGGSVAWIAHIGGAAAGIILIPIFKRRSVRLWDKSS